MRKRVAAAAASLVLVSMASTQPLPLAPYWADGEWEAPIQHPWTSSPNGHPTGNYGAFACGVAEGQVGPNQPGQSPASHGHNAVHLSLIPKGIHQGKVLIWAHWHLLGSAGSQTRGLLYTIWDPAAAIGPSSGVPGQPGYVAANPESYCFDMVLGEGDLFCAGHAWTASGDLLVVGGTKNHYHAANPNWEGSRLAYLWRPPSAGEGLGGTWTHVQDAFAVPSPEFLYLDQDRWYPAVIALGPRIGVPDRDPMMVAGGTNNGPTVNSYQVWLPPLPAEEPQFPAGFWELSPNPPGPLQPYTFRGPTANSYLGNYPRIHLMSAGGNASNLANVFLAGEGAHADRMNHYTANGVWQNTSTPWPQNSEGERNYGSSVLMPILGAGVYKDRVMITGGSKFTPPGSPIYQSAEIVDGGALGTGPVWKTAAPLHTKRWFHNTVLLPDTRVLAVGGESQHDNTSCSEVPALAPEVFDLAGDSGGPIGSWTAQQPSPVVRDYHSTALLLPSGKVLTAGGDSRTYVPSADCDANPLIRTVQNFPTDYQVFQPDYVASGLPRPVIDQQAAAGSAIDLLYDTPVDVFYSNVPEGTTISRVVLLRAGSVTHHADCNQRLVELNFVHEATGQLLVSIPGKYSGILPRGYYMMFLVSSQLVTTRGLPSEAAWVRIR